MPGIQRRGDGQATNEEGHVSEGGVLEGGGEVAAEGKVYYLADQTSFNDMSPVCRQTAVFTFAALLLPLPPANVTASDPSVAMCIQLNVFNGSSVFVYDKLSKRKKPASVSHISLT